MHGKTAALLPTLDTVPIDYDKSVAQVYEDISRFCMRVSGVLPVLSFVEKVQPEQRRGSRPSWVPDWSAPHQPAGMNR